MVSHFRRLPLDNKMLPAHLTQFFAHALQLVHDKQIHFHLISIFLFGSDHSVIFLFVPYLFSPISFLALCQGNSWVAKRQSVPLAAGTRMNQVGPFSCSLGEIWI